MLTYNTYQLLRKKKYANNVNKLVSDSKEVTILETSKGQCN